MSVLGIVLAAAVATSTTCASVEHREAQWRESSILFEALLERSERQLESSEREVYALGRALLKTEALAVTAPAPGEAGGDPLVWVAVSIVVVSAFIGGFFVGKAVTR